MVSPEFHKYMKDVDWVYDPDKDEWHRFNDWQDQTVSGEHPNVEFSNTNWKDTCKSKWPTEKQLQDAIDDLEKVLDKIDKKTATRKQKRREDQYRAAQKSMKKMLKTLKKKGKLP